MTNLRNLIALSAACKTAHDDAKRAGWTNDAEILHDIGVDIANLIASHLRHAQRVAEERTS